MAERKTAQEMAKQQREISISEFFEKNKHLLGFDNPTKALLISVKEAVDNSIDAAEEAGILPDIKVKIKNMRDDVFHVSIEDNGPGIVKEQVPKIYGKLLYGSKFHRFKQSIGQQGIGISAVCLYSQLTAGKPIKVFSKTANDKKTREFHIKLDTKTNSPEIIHETVVESSSKTIKDHGVRVEFEIVGRYRKSQGVDEYLEQISIANPFINIKYKSPDGRSINFKRSVEKLPKEPKTIKPHPYGIELGILIRMIGDTKAKKLSGFIHKEFSSVGAGSIKEICKIAKLKEDRNPKNLNRDELERLMKAMQKVKLQRPPVDVLSPIGKEELEKTLKKRYPEAELVAAISRKPEVYRGIPFQIEAAVVYDSHNFEKDKPSDLIRFANRIPLLYQAGACALTEAITTTAWKRYGLQQSGSSIPVGPCKIIIHVCSSWVPFVSESKEAVASYPELIKEMKLAIQDVGRGLALYLSGKRKASEQKRRLKIFDRYAHEVAESLSVLTEKDEKMVEKELKELVKERIKLKEVEESEQENFS